MHYPIGMRSPGILVSVSAVSATVLAVACAPYVPPVPANPLGDERAVRIDATPASPSKRGPVQMVLRKQVERRWITLGQLCESEPEATNPCPDHGGAHVTYVAPGTYKVRAEYVGAAGRTYWASVTGDFVAGYVYTCRITDEETEGCDRIPVNEASAAAPPMHPSSAPAPAAATAPAPAPTPAAATAPAPAPAATAPASTPAAACAKDIDCAGDLICTDGRCASPAAAPPAVEITPVAPPPAAAVAPRKSAACDRCRARCAAHQGACNAGTVSSCYELGACLCECKLDAGGCGDSLTALTECIATNRARANPTAD